MSARIIHYGTDECHRLMVLETAGYVVAQCGSLADLRSELLTAWPLDDVLISDTAHESLAEALALARAHSSSPVVLFLNSNPAHEQSGFDLVVQCLTPPEVWLNDIDALIERNRAELSQPG